MVDESREESLPEAFWAVARELRGLSREHLAPWDLNPSQGRAMRTLIHNRDGIRLRDLAERLHIAPRSATEVVDDLESRGFAERLPDPGDRRATLVRLTEQGLGIMKAIHETRHSATEQFFSRISEADRAELTRILRQLHP
ncbi:MarR family winged helix-turn-helix transcriptional regulator [Pseudonocardia spinosispora]|uniref:MarR family winged helix-turn-helix transcriptional regulator n=1 Tax=Pseudonocardia spinosispora TaxID=103441 RepID=UPI00041DCB20|nr:MarR family transcriptional regulator [Pseudonocardia spinosispora]